ncbi:hypothetical protein H0O02_01245 [Candidatus Micrarchaeota archaeon]|nr:hypothetical protein [Candidatus Micrarchaeota archaeon]
MLKPAKMKKIRVFALKSKLPPLIKSLHEAGVVEIRKFRAEGLMPGRPLAFFDDVSMQLVRLRSMVSLMDKDAVSAANAKAADITGEAAVKEADRLNSAAGERLKAIATGVSAISEEVSKINSQLKIISKLDAFKGMDFSRLSTKSLAFVLGEVPNAKIEMLKSRIGEAGGDYNILAPEGRGIALIIYGRGSPSIDHILVESGFSAVQLPEGFRTPEEEHSKLKLQLEEKKKALKTAEEERKALSEKHAKKALELIDVLGIESERAEISSRFAFSSTISVIEGWVQESDFEKVKKLVGAMGENAVLEDVEIGEHEQPPIVLDNPGYSHPFEFITKSFSLPNYFELDPTVIYFIGLPIIYGMIVGDVLYGLLSLIIASWFLKKFSKSYIMSSVAGIWYISAFPSIFFGLIFDEWGGMSHAGWFEVLAQWGLPLSTTPLYHGVFSRLHDFPLLLGITLLIGMIHVGLGFVLGAVNLWGHHRKHAYAKLAWLGAEIGGAFAVCSGFLGLLPSAFLMPAMAVLVISVAVLIYLEGAVGALELPGLVGNILSYARIAAVGVSGVVLAEIINEFFMPLPQAGLLAIVMLPLLVALHMMNTFIAMFESLIQVGRLNIIEFKSKFVEGGGMLFSPFALRYKK